MVTTAARAAWLAAQVDRLQLRVAALKASNARADGIAAACLEAAIARFATELAAALARPITGGAPPQAAPVYRRRRYPVAPPPDAACAPFVIGEQADFGALLGLPA